MILVSLAFLGGGDFESCTWYLPTITKHTKPVMKTIFANRMEGSAKMVVQYSGRGRINTQLYLCILVVI